MDNSSTYDTDILVWSEQQASALRDLALSRRDLPNELDLEHVAEEIECVGRSEFAAVQSLIRQILVHIIKAVSIPDAAPIRHWQAEVVAFHAAIFDHLSPSMIPRLQMNATWRWARRTAEAQLAEHGQALAPNLPLDCPLEAADIVDREFNVSLAIEQVQAAMRSIDKRD
jgi:hypothetical protein